MRKIPLFSSLVLATAILLAGCTTEPEGEGRYSEIRIDAFSHFWLANRLAADESSGDTLWSAGGFQGLVLVDKPRYKPESLPAHTVDSIPVHGKRIFYSAQPSPEEFACQFRSKGRLVSTDSLMIQGAVLASVADTGTGAITDYTFTVLAMEEWKPCFVAYIPGKGFMLDMMSWEVGEIVILYR